MAPEAVGTVAPATWVIALAIAYLIGSLPFGYWIAKAATGEDVRASGSGSTGATNVVRKAGLAAGLATYVLDVSKGMLALWVAAQWLGLSSATAQGAIGLAAILGHIFPVYLGFRGVCLVPSPEFSQAPWYSLPDHLCRFGVRFDVT